jgi:hypothetical protein
MFLSGFAYRPWHWKTVIRHASIPRGDTLGGADTDVGISSALASRRERWFVPSRVYARSLAA